MDRIYTAKTVREKKKRKDIKEQTYLQFLSRRLYNINNIRVNIN